MPTPSTCYWQLPTCESKSGNCGDELTGTRKLIQLNGSKLEELQSNAQTRNRQQDDRSLKILDKLEHANSSLLGAKTLLAKLSAGLDRLQQFSLELEDSVHRILSLNVSTYDAVVAIKSGLPSRLERALIGDPAILEDGLGRIAPVHLQFVNSWDAFDAVLEVRFRGLDGHEKVIKRDFVLQEHATGFEIRRSRAWEASILPGQRIEMSFVFSQEGSFASTAVDASCTSCPKCGFVCSEKQDSEVQWYGAVCLLESPRELTISSAKCNLIYQRIIEIYQRIIEREEMEATTSNAVTVGHPSQPRFGQKAFRSLPPPTTSASKRKREDGLDETFARFKRVRIIYRLVKLRVWRPIRRRAFRASTLSSHHRGISPPGAIDNPGSLDGLRSPDAFRDHVPPRKLADPDGLLEQRQGHDLDDSGSETGADTESVPVRETAASPQLALIPVDAAEH
jgi:hypothetical protein